MKCSHTLFSLCSDCGKLIVPPQDLNFFKLFNLPETYFLDKEQLSSSYYNLSRNLHPDKFELQPDSSNLNAALHWFSLVNKGYEQLKSDVSRAEYILELNQVPAPQGNVGLPQNLALDYFELQERIEDQTAGNNELEIFLTRIESEMSHADLEIKNHFKKWEHQKGPELQSVARLLNLRNYLSSIKRDVEKRCQKSL